MSEPRITEAELLEMETRPWADGAVRMFTELRRLRALISGVLGSDGVAGLQTSAETRDEFCCEAAHPCEGHALVAEAKAIREETKP